MRNPPQPVSHVVGDVRQGRSQVEETIGLLALLVANAEAVAAVPEEISKRKIN